jgi:hypothetical protein
MNFKNCYTLSIFLCLFLTSIPLHAVLDPKRMPPEKETALTMLGKSFGGYGLGLVTSGLILAAFCNASKTSYDSMSYIALGLLSSFAGGSLANFCVHRYPKQTAWTVGGLLSSTLIGAPICYKILDLLPITDQARLFANYYPQR